jgi:anhydro-N-acetylmuramic acid kinase
LTLLRTIGTMSGTSMDGIDLALLETDGENELRPGPTGFAPYRDEDRGLLREALKAGANLTLREERPEAVARAERMVTQRHAEAIDAFLVTNNLSRDGIDLVGFHGQTVLHRPQDRLTVQIGDGPGLARRLGIAVAHDFRAADVAAGGQGAPIVPVYHRALALATGMAGPLILLNVGGVANVTFLEDGRDPIACDTGPGNALLDDLMLARTGQPMDRHGMTAARGRVDAEALARLMAHDFFRLPAPKSLDRNAFSPAPVAALSTEDAAATLTAFTAQSVAGSLALLPNMPHALIVCGGGARNPILVRELVQRTDCRVTTAEACGWSSDAIEAQAFGYLAARTFHNLPLTFPTTTGVPEPMSGGRVAMP